MLYQQDTAGEHLIHSAVVSSAEIVDRVFVRNDLVDVPQPLNGSLTSDTPLKHKVVAIVPARCHSIIKFMRKIVYT